jgi:homoserine dehydrogenase
MKKKSVGIGIIGLGVIAGQVVKVLTEKQKEIHEKAGCDIVLKRIKVLKEDLKRPLAKGLDKELLTTSDDEFFNTEGMDIVFEAIGGENPALNYLKKAMKNGKYVVTSNKEVVAKNVVELLSLAAENGVALRYEASVGGGIPLILPFQHGLVANEIKGIYAIINGTTNYILSRMADEEIEFQAVLKQAKELGYAEPDPTNDIEGYDAAYKLAILTSLAFQSQVRPNDIYSEGISKLNSRDFRYAHELGFAIKLLAIAKRNDGQIEVRVHPVFIPGETFLAKVDGVYNAILAEGDLVGKVIFLGEGAGPSATSSAVIADIIASTRDICFGGVEKEIWSMDRGIRVKPMDEIETRYYIRMNIVDKAGVLASVSRALGDRDISISSAIQKESNEKTRTAEIVIMTHPAKEKAVRQALDKIAELDVVVEVNNCVRVEEI